MERILVASDYKGYWLKQAVVEYLESKDFDVVEMGAADPTLRDNYVNVADEAMQLFQDEKLTRAVLICGSGIGICMRANRYPFARAFVAHNGLTAGQAREHNDANVICLSGEETSIRWMKMHIDRFLTIEFNAARRADRIAALSAPINI